MKMRLSFSLAAVAGILACCLNVQATTVVVNDTFFDSGNSITGDPPPLVNEGGGIFSYTFSNLGTFSAAGSDKLVLGFQNKDEGAVTGPPITEVTYDGAALAPAILAGSFRQRNSIFYLDNVASDGDLVVKFNDGATIDQASYVFGLYALDNTLPGVGDTATAQQINGSLNAGGPTVDIPGTSPSGFVLNIWARNNGGLELVSPIPPFSEDVDLSVATSGGALVSVFASAVVESPGSYNTVVSGLGGNVPAATVAAAAFPGMPEAADEAPVTPEPATLGLAVLAMAGLAARRRRA